MRVVACLALASVGSAVCLEPECAADAAEEVDAGSLLQVKADVKPTATKPSDLTAATALWEANGRQKVMVGWGTGDPCVDSAPEGQGNAQGFGAWKGVGCVVCEDDPRYYCISQIWLHQKNLTGTIPEEFHGLTELTWLFLSGNNMTGPLPTSIWHTFPKLREIDLTYNTIDGDLPLDALSSISTLRTLLVHDNHFNRLVYTGGGFENLRTLDFKYNRDMYSIFPQGFAELPNLRSLAIHDSNTTGAVPEGSWPSIETLIISGTGGLCGPLPSACSREGVYCDVSQDLPSCDTA